MKRISLFLALALCSISATAKDIPALGLKLVAGGFTSPINLVPFNDGSGHMIVGDQIGVAKILSKDGEVLEKPFLDLRDRLAKLNDGRFDERGLLGIALHPNFKKNGKVYTFFSAPLRSSAPSDWNHTSRLSEFRTMKGNPLQVDHTSERIVLEIDQPAFNHNGGRIAFGPDGYLYIGVGDGGNGNDQGKGHSEDGNGQDLSKLMGKILRIDVNRKKGYGIPKDNPFADGKKGRPEIWAYGIRNPWGISFDQGGDHHLFAADVGQSMFEEINLISKGGNYGWRMREGKIGFDHANPVQAPESTPAKGKDGSKLIDPILTYKNLKGHNSNRHAQDIRGISVTGGYVYRGKDIPALNGHYVFADWSRNWGLADGVVLCGSPKGEEWELSVLPIEDFPKKGRIGAYVVAMGQDADGEVYVLTNDTNSLKGESGKIYKLVRK